MLLVAAIALSGSTFAWFSMNNLVTADTMEVTAVTAVNLLINDAKEGSVFGNIAHADEEYTGKLMPASATANSIPQFDALKFNAVKDGQMFGTDNAGGEATSDTTWRASGVAAMSGASNGFYAPYTFKVKSAANSSEPDLDVYVTKIAIEHKNAYTAHAKAGDTTETTIPTGALKGNDGTAFADVSEYNSATTYYTLNTADLSGAARVAIFVDNVLFGIYDKTGAAGSKKGVGATFVDGGTFTDPDKNPETTDAVAAETVALTAVGNAKTFKVGTDPVTVDVVVWLEGEDPACINVNAGAAYTLTFELEVKQS